MADEKKPTGIRYQDKDLFWGIQVYVINDTNPGEAYDLVGIDLRPGHVKYQLCKPGEYPFEVYDWQATLIKPLDLPAKEEEGD